MRFKTNGSEETGFPRETRKHHVSMGMERQGHANGMVQTDGHLTRREGGFKSMEANSKIGVLMLMARVR